MKRYAVVIVVALCATFGATVALASQGRHNKHYYGGRFAILSRVVAHSATASQETGLPSTAVQAAAVGDNNVYAFERDVGLESEVCVADQVGTTVATACSRSGAAEREGVDLILPNVGTAPTVVVLVPNGVKTVSFIRAGNTAAVDVANNVAIAEGAVTAYHYDMPSGGQQSVAVQNH